MPPNIEARLRARRKMLAALRSRVKSLRQKAGLTQAELARRLEVSQATIGMIETGKRLPSAQLLTALAQALGIKEDRLCR